jgi:hypothetical protein
MKIDKLIKGIGLFFSSVAGVLYFISLFAPSELKKNNFDFVISILKNSSLEIIIIFIIGITIIFHKSLFAEKKSNILLICAIIFVSILNFGTIKKIFRSRYYYYNHIDEAHKYQIYKKLCNSLNNDEYYTGLDIIDDLISTYPDESLHLSSFQASLKSQLIFSQRIYPLDDRGLIFLNASSDSLINKYKLVQMLQCFHYFPNSIYEFQLSQAYKLIINKLTYLDENYDKVKNGELNNFISTNSWFFFDNDLEASLKVKKISTEKYFSDLLSSNTKEVNLSLFSGLWFLPQIFEELNWKQSLFFHPNIELDKITSKMPYEELRERSK